MSGGIFVSYRRDDAKHAAGRLVDRLSRSIPDEQIFIDIDNIDPGLDFRKVLTEKVQACDVLLAVIGPGWMSSRNEDGQLRLDDPRDFVRIEIEAALARDVRVIPVLVDGARMPREQDLPEPLKSLSYRNAVQLAHERFTADADHLAKALSRAVGMLDEDKVPVVREAKQDATPRLTSANFASHLQTAAITLLGVAYVIAAALSPIVLPTMLGFAQTDKQVAATIFWLMVGTVATSFLVLRFGGHRLSANQAVFYCVGAIACTGVSLTGLFVIANYTNTAERGGPFVTGIALTAVLSIISAIVFGRRWNRRVGGKLE